MTPAGVFTGFWRWFGVGAAALGLLAVLILGGWRAGWWFRDQNVNRNTQLLHGSYSYQSAEQADLSQKIADVTTETTQMAGVSPSSQQYADLHAQRLAEAGQACQDAAQITAIPAAETGWVSANCLAGAASPDSPLDR